MDSSTVLGLFTLVGTAVAALFAAYRSSQKDIIKGKDDYIADLKAELARRDAKIESLEGIVDRNTSALSVNAEAQERMMNYLEKQQRQRGGSES